MTYFIKFPNVDFDPMMSSCILGEVSLNKFWPEQGWYHLHWLSENGMTDEYFSKIIIYDDNKNSVNILKILNEISKLHMA